MTRDAEEGLRHPPFDRYELGKIGDRPRRKPRDLYDTGWLVHERPELISSDSAARLKDWMIRGLTNGTAHGVQVRAGNAVGDGPWSVTATGTPVATETAGARGDRAALIDLYNATNGANWRDNENWNSDEPLDDWRGVNTDASGRVTELQVAQNELTGSIPSSLGNLGELKTLNLGHNELTGSIPSSLGNLVSLERLTLGYNELTGSIPPSLGNLVGLEWLWLGSNELTGSLPSTLGRLTNLKRLNLDWNTLTGSIPSSLGNLVKLEIATLNENQLTGSIPSSLGRLTSLKVLQIRRSKLTGSIPPSLGRLTNLYGLGLVWNRLSGSIPAGLCKLKHDIGPQFGEGNKRVDLPCASSSTTVQHAVGVSVSDAHTNEAGGATLAFTVTLNQTTTEYPCCQGSRHPLWRTPRIWTVIDIEVVSPHANAADATTAQRGVPLQALQAPAPTTVRPAAIDLLTAPRVVTLGQIPVVVVRSATALRARPQTDVHFAWSSAA